MESYKISSDFFTSKRYIFKNGALAHLVERVVRNHKVVGSSPICSILRKQNLLNKFLLCKRHVVTYAPFYECKIFYIHFLYASDA